MPSIYAQSGFTLSWDSEVGCLEYDFDDKRYETFENIEDDDCLLVCEESIVVFTIDYGAQQVTEINWETDGGQILNLSNGNATAEIQWPYANNNGSVTMHITLANGQEFNQSLCVTTKPKPQGGFEILGQQSEFFCSESELFFENNAYTTGGSQIVSSLWDFGDGTTSNDFHSSHTYNDDGIYTITLTVYDECNCSNTWETKIIITKPGLQISCPTVVCEGAMETYTIEGPAYMNGEVNCSNYDWIVEGGHLVGQGQDWIDVLWDDVGEDGFGYVFFDQDNCDVGCDNILVAKIPVITSEGTITGGKTELCIGEQSRYAIPRWPTTDVEWKVVNVNYPGQNIPDALVLVDQRNEIVVDATGLPPGNYILQATYTNTLLKCGGEAEFYFSVLHDLQIDETSFEPEICEGNTVTFMLTQTIPGVTWSFIKEGQTVATINGTGSNSQATYQFTQPGHYTVKATANNHCTAYAQIDVVEIPDVTYSFIEGSQAVCPEVGEEYTFVGNTGGFDVEWDVDHGEFLGPNMGETVTIKFAQGFTSYQVTAKLVNPYFQNCFSNDVNLSIQRFEPDAQIVQTTGNPIKICASSVESFELQGYPNMDSYEWIIEPQELANVSSGQGTENVNILFNEPYLEQTNGTITVGAKVCGIMEDVAQVNFEINPSPELSIIKPPTPDVICPETPFTVKVNSSISIMASSLSISFDGINNAIIPPATGSSGSYQFSGIILPNANSSAAVNIPYTIIASGPDLCGITQISGSIVRNPAPIIQIWKEEGADAYCNANDIDVVLKASIQGTGVQENDIQWYKEGVQTPVGSGVTYIPNSFGTYTAQATNNPYGCTTVSAPNHIIQDCSTLLPGCLTESVVVTGEWTQCNTIKLTATYTGNPAIKMFIRNAGFTAGNTQPLPSTTTGNTFIQEFKTDAAGTYVFWFYAEYANCELMSEAISIDVDYKAIMNYSVACNANDYEVTILNQTSRIPGVMPEVDYTIIKNPGGSIPVVVSGDMATADLDDGNYMLTLTVSNPGKPTCEVSETIDLQMPNAGFTIAPNQNPTCAENPVDLQPDNSTLNATYLWQFQNASNTMESISANLAETNPAGTPIILTVIDPFGCSDIDSVMIVVNKADFGGTVAANPSDICEGDMVSLEYTQLNPGSSSEYLWFNKDGLLGTSIIPTFTVISPNPGEYWTQIEDNYGCIDKGIGSAFINHIKPPHLSAKITGSICQGEDISLTGILNPATVEYQIRRKKNNGNFIVIVPWTTGSNIDYTDVGLGVGDYTYEVEYKDLYTECSDIAYFTATVHPTPTVSIQMTILECSTPYHPYMIELTATGNQPGTYTWSNGMSGSTIIIDHGGPYRVRFKPEGADCEAMATFQAPKSPDEYTWIFPTGCFDYCEKNFEQSYIVGPIPYFEEYAYDLDGIPVASGFGFVQDLPLTYLDGDLSLYLHNGHCDTTTDTLHVRQEKCGPCEIEIVIKNVDKGVNNAGFMYFQLFGHITNPYNIMVSVQLTSPNGIFSPASVNIPPNDVYDFTTNPIDFIPNGSISSIQVQYVVTGNDGNGVEILCSDFLIVNLVGPQYKTMENSGYAKMTVAPNPTLSFAQVQYTIENVKEFKSGTIKLYNLTGRLIKTESINESQGQKTFDMSGLASGAYIVVLLHEGERIGQQILIRE